MKKWLKVSLSVLLLLSLCLCVFGCTTPTESEEETVAKEEQTCNLGDYAVTIDSARMAKDFEGKDVLIVKYIFENVKNEESASFMWALADSAFQNGVGLNKSYVVDESANYNSDNQSKEIKKGASIEVEVAYELNDTTSDVEVEVTELISLDDKKVTKTFKLGE